MQIDNEEQEQENERKVTNQQIRKINVKSVL